MVSEFHQDTSTVPDSDFTIRQSAKRRVYGWLWRRLNYPTSTGMVNHVRDRRGGTQQLMMMQTSALVDMIVNEIVQRRTAPVPSPHPGSFLAGELARLEQEQIYFDPATLAEGAGVIRREQELTPISECAFDTKAQITYNSNYFDAVWPGLDADPAGDDIRATHDDVTSTVDAEFDSIGAHLPQQPRRSGPEKKTKPSGHVVVPIGTYAKTQSQFITAVDSSRYYLQVSNAWNGSIWTMAALDEKYYGLISDAPRHTQRVLHAYLLAARMPFAMLWASWWYDDDSRNWLLHVANNLQSGDHNRYELLYSFLYDIRNYADQRNYYALVRADYSKEWVFTVRGKVALNTGADRIELCWFAILQGINRDGFRLLAKRMRYWKDDKSSPYDKKLRSLIDDAEMILHRVEKRTFNRNIDLITAKVAGHLSLSPNNSDVIPVLQDHFGMSQMLKNSTKSFRKILQENWPEKGIYTEEPPLHLYLTCYDWAWPASDRMTIHVGDEHRLRSVWKAEQVKPRRSIQRLSKQANCSRSVDIWLYPPRRQSGDVSFLYWHHDRTQEPTQGSGEEPEAARADDDHTPPSTRNFCFTVLPEKTISPIVALFAVFSALVTLGAMSLADMIKLGQLGAEFVGTGNTDWQRLAQCTGIALLNPSIFSSLAALTFATSLAALTLELRTTRTDVMRNLLRPLHYQAMHSLIFLWVGLGLVFFRDVLVPVVPPGSAAAADLPFQWADPVAALIRVTITVVWSGLFLVLIGMFFRRSRRILFAVRPFMDR